MKSLKVTLAVSLAVLLGACATVPTGPSIMALPGSQKPFEVFRADDYDCRAYASDMIAGPGDGPAVRSAVVGTAVGAVAGAAIGGHRGAAVGAGTGLLVGSVAGADASRSYGRGSQRQYDQAYIQCMYGRGHRVPVSAEFARSMPTARTASGVPVPPPPAYPPTTLPPPDYRP